MYILAKLIVFLPLFSGIVNGLFCKKLPQLTASIIATLSISISCLAAICIFINVGIERQIVYVFVAKWLSIDGIEVSWSIFIDQLTAIMFLLVTSVSAVVHIYSIGYMHDDKNLAKFLSYLSLFTFFMLMLVSADNFLQLFFGWEGVGLCSYLLIGYYSQKESANSAAVKAFVTNRISDFAFIAGLLMIIFYAESLKFNEVFAMSESLAQMVVSISGYEFGVLDLICLLLFVGCMGKSAQIGLHVWLPDAMEGPTPVSALIHAATMVTAGVFLLARCSYMFEYSPFVLQIIAIIGSVTCLFAASVAICQTDIKKIIAYSTCSQLGYMFFACGVSAYQVGIFHLVTHGFFKALLFLSAGSVIHACHEQDIFKMGGLKSQMPVTYANFWVGSLAIVGIFPFAGFYSKDLVLEAAYEAENVFAGHFAFYLGIVAAILTAIYSLKIIMLTFHGKTRLPQDVFDHAHESPKIMNLPLMILVFGSLFSGMIGYYLIQIDQPYGYFLGSIFNLSNQIEESAHHVPILVQILPLIVGLFGMLLGYYIYKNNVYLALSKIFGPIYSLLKNKYFFDEIYDRLIILPVKFLSKLSAILDVKFIDRFGPNGFSHITSMFGWMVSQIQTGYIFNYAFYMIFALTITITIFLAKYLPLIWGAV